MEIQLQDGWMWFTITFGAMLAIALIMKSQSRFFYTKDVVVRRFSIMDMELPGSAQEMVNLIKGIFKLPGEQSKITLRALRGQLYIDFLFMPAAYGSIFILCMIASDKMPNFGKPLFLFLAWIQTVAWLCDITENIYLLQKIKPDVVCSKPAAHMAYQVLEIVKWGITLTGAVCSVFGLFYFWLVGSYLYNSLHYFVIIIAEILLFVIAGKILYEKSKAD